MHCGVVSSQRIGSAGDELHDQLSATRDIVQRGQNKWWREAMEERLKGHATNLTSTNGGKSAFSLVIRTKENYQEQEHMQVNITRVAFRGEGNSSLVLALEDRPYVIKLKKAPVAVTEERYSGPSERRFDSTDAASVRYPTRHPLTFSATDHMSGSRSQSDQEPVGEYWLSVHKYQLSFIENVAVPLLGASLIDVPTLVKLGRNELVVLLAESRKDRASHRLAKEPSPELGCGLVFPDYCTFKSSLPADLVLPQAVTNGLPKCNLDPCNQATDDGGRASRGEYSLPVPVVGPVISVEIKSKMGFLPLPVMSRAASALPGEFMAYHSSSPTSGTVPESCYYSSCSFPGVSHPLKTQSLHGHCSHNASHCQRSTSYHSEGEHLKSRLCRFHMVQHHKLSDGRIQHISNYCPLDLFSGCPERMESAILELLHNPQNNLRVFCNRHQIFGGEHQKLGKDLFGIIRSFENMLHDFLPGHNDVADSSTNLSCNDKYSDAKQIANSESSGRSDSNDHFKDFSTQGPSQCGDRQSTKCRNVNSLGMCQSGTNFSLNNGCHVDKSNGSRWINVDLAHYSRTKHEVESTQCSEQNGDTGDKHIGKRKVISSESTVPNKAAEYESSRHLCNLIRLALCLPLQEDRCQEAVSRNVRLETRHCTYSTKCMCYDDEYNEETIENNSGSTGKNRFRAGQDVSERDVHPGEKRIPRHEIPRSSVLYRVLQAQQLCSADLSTIYTAFHNSHQAEDFVDGRFPWPAIPSGPGLANDEKAPHETTSQFESRMLWKYLVALTARDCSLMLTMQKIDTGRWNGNLSSPRLNVLEYGEERYLLQIGIVDLEPKALDRIPKHIRDDLTMARNFSLSTT